MNVSICANKPSAYRVITMVIQTHYQRHQNTEQHREYDKLMNTKLPHIHHNIHQYTPIYILIHIL